MPDNYFSSDDNFETTPTEDSTSFQADGSGRLWPLNQDNAGDESDEDERTLLVQGANGSYVPLDGSGEDGDFGETDAWNDGAASPDGGQPQPETDSAPDQPDDGDESDDDQGQAGQLAPGQNNAPGQTNLSGSAPTPTPEPTPTPKPLLGSPSDDFKSIHKPYQQIEKNGCQPAAVAIGINEALGRPKPAAVQWYDFVDGVGKAINPGAKYVNEGSLTNLQNSVARIAPNYGVIASNINNQVYGLTDKALQAAASPRTPVVAMARLPNGPLHEIVITGVTANSLTYIDPASGETKKSMTYIDPATGETKNDVPSLIPNTAVQIKAK